MLSDKATVAGGNGGFGGVAGFFAVTGPGGGGGGWIDLFDCPNVAADNSKQPASNLKLISFIIMFFIMIP